MRPEDRDELLHSFLAINAMLREEVKALRRAIEARQEEAKHNPNWRLQARAPRGSADGGQWTGDGGNSSSLPKQDRAPRNAPVANPAFVGNILRGQDALWSVKPANFGADSGIDGSVLLVPDLPNLVARQDWARIRPDYADLAAQIRNLQDVQEIISHHTGNEVTPHAVEVLHRSNNDEWRFLREGGMIQSYRYSDVGYHYLIAADGTVYEGRSIYFEGAHVEGHNRRTIGIAFLGDYSDRPLTAEAVASAQNLISALDGLTGHRLRLSTHGQHDPAKRDELTGAIDQIRGPRRD